MAENEISGTKRRRRPLAITFFGGLAIVGLISMPILAGAPDGDKMPDTVRFIGHFHPVLLHLPIGVFALILIQELGSLLCRNRNQLRDYTLFPLFFGAASSILAVIVGFLLYVGGVEYSGNELVERHLWGGLVFAVLAVITFIMKAWAVALDGNPKHYRWLLFTSVGVMGFASHDGASITHGETYLTDYAPEPVRKVLGLKPKKQKSLHEKPALTADGAVISPIVFTDLVAPILERRCVQCHKEGKAKGKLRMDTYEMLIKGGSEGPSLEPGNVSGSSIVARIELPMDDEDHMPPEGKSDIEDFELTVLKWWIEQGADPKKSLADFEVPAPIQEAISKIDRSAALDPSATSSTPVSESPEADGDSASVEAPAESATNDE